VSNKTLTLTVFLLSTVIGLATVGYFNHYFAKQALQSDAEQLLYKFHDALLEAREVLDSLPAPEQFLCSSENIAILTKLAYEHPSIRLIGTLHANGSDCSSSPLQLSLKHYHERILAPDLHRLTDNLALASAGIVNENVLDLLMVRSHGDSRYYASIDPFIVNYLMDLNCEDCLEYDFFVDGSPRLEFRSAAMNQASFIEHKASRLEDTINVDLFVRGTEAFYDHYKQLSWFSSLAFALLLASVITLLSYRLLTIRQSMERIIKDALAHNEFVPFYQPVVDSRTGEVVGAEMLARWRKTNGDIVPPYQFIPFSEDSGMIIEISQQLLEKTAADIKALNWENGSQFMSVNIVPEHLKTNHLFDLIQQLCQRNNITPKAFSLEITERMKIDDLAQARRALQNFYDLGVELKLDDAGTGYGGFSYIQELNISTLKIDKMFVDTIASEDLKGAVLESMISFAKDSHLGMIAEGVEDKHQVSYLQERNVYLIQGYVYAKPMPIEEFVDWVKKTH